MALLTLPVPPNLGNARLHWRAKHRERQAYYDAAHLALAVQEVPRTPRDDLTWIWPAYLLRRAMDDDNAIARLKFAIDAVVLWGYLKDDSRDYVRVLAPPRIETVGQKGLDPVLEFWTDDDAFRCFRAYVNYLTGEQTLGDRPPPAE